jgi:hypothetical protein
MGTQLQPQKTTIVLELKSFNPAVLYYVILSVVEPPHLDAAPDPAQGEAK